MFTFGLIIVLLFSMSAISGLMWFILLIESFTGQNMLPAQATGFHASSGLIAITLVTFLLGVNALRYMNEVSQVSDDTTVEIVDESLGTCP